MYKNFKNRFLLFKRRDLFSFFVLTFFVFIYRLPFLSVPLERDEGGYAYLGWLWVTGKTIPYLQSFDHKFPPVFLIYGLSYLLGGNSFIGIRIMSFVYFFLVISVFYFICLKFAGRLAAFLTTLLLIIYMSSLRLEGGDFNTEILYILPLLISTFLIWKLKKANKVNLILVFITGLVSSLATFFKPVAILPIALFFLWLLYSQRKINIVLLISFFTMGFLLPILITLIYFNQYHALPSLIENLVYYNQKYNADGLWILTAPVHRGGGILNIINWLITFPVVIEPLLVLALATLYLYRKSKSYLWWMGFIYIFSSWVGAKMGGTREFPHYYIPLVVGLSFCLLLLFDKLIEIKKKISAIFITVILAGLVVLPEVPILVGGPLNVLKGEFGIYGYWFNDAPKVAEWILKNTNKEDSLLVWANEPEIYFYSQRKSLTEHINFYSFFYRPQVVKENWLRGVKEFPPDWIITYVNDPPSYKELIQLFPDMTGYNKVSEIGMYIIFQKIK